MSPRVLVLALCVAGFLAPAGGSSDHQPMVLGYYTSWGDLTPAELRYENFTHLAYAFLFAAADGDVKLENDSRARELTRLAHEHGVQVVLSLGGSDSGEAFGAMMKDRRAVERYVAQTVKIVQECGFDGLDVDWEHPMSAEDRTGLVVLVRKLRQALPGKALITMAVSAGDWTGEWLDEKELLPLVDFLNVMTYDMHGPWSEHAGHNAPLYEAKDDVEDGKYRTYEAMMSYWTEKKKWPKEKLNVGIPTYGYGYAVSKWYEKPDGKPAHPDVGYRDIPGLLKDGWTRVWDKDACVPYLWKAGIKELITYDDPESARLKGEWARKGGFGGIFFWEVSQDWMDRNNALVLAAREGFSKGKEGEEPSK